MDCISAGLFGVKRGHFFSGSILYLRALLPATVTSAYALVLNATTLPDGDIGSMLVRFYDLHAYIKVLIAAFICLTSSALVIRMAF
jgi:hypothetical protein